MYPKMCQRTHLTSVGQKMYKVTVLDIVLIGLMEKIPYLTELRKSRDYCVICSTGGDFFSTNFVYFHPPVHTFLQFSLEFTEFMLNYFHRTYCKLNLSIY